MYGSAWGAADRGRRGRLRSKLLRALAGAPALICTVVHMYGCAGGAAHRSRLGRLRSKLWEQDDDDHHALNRCHCVHLNQVERCE